MWWRGSKHELLVTTVASPFKGGADKVNELNLLDQATIVYHIGFTRFVVLFLCRSHHACTRKILLVAASDSSRSIMLVNGGCEPCSCLPTWSPRAVDPRWTTPLQSESMILYSPLPLLYHAFTLSFSRICGVLHEAKTWTLQW